MNHTFLDTPVSPFSSLHETLEKYQYLIPEFKPITITFPNSMQFPPLISLDLNHSLELPRSTSGTGVYIPNYVPLKNCVINEIIHKTCGHDSDQTNSFWASLDR